MELIFGLKLSLEYAGLAREARVLAQVIGAEPAESGLLPAMHERSAQIMDRIERITGLCKQAA